MEDARILRTRRTLPAGLNTELIRRRSLDTTLWWRATLDRLICIQWINVGRVGHRVCDFPIDRVRLLRQCKLAGEGKN
jgi:hypothetical protein